MSGGVSECIKMSCRVPASFVIYCSGPKRIGMSCSGPETSKISGTGQERMSGRGPEKGKGLSDSGSKVMKRMSKKNWSE